MKRQLGQSGIEVSAIGIGTWAIGGRMGTEEDGLPHADQSLDGRHEDRIGLAHELVNGGIDARFTSVTGDQRINCDTVNGKINLTLPGNADASVSVETVNGSIDASDFDEGELMTPDAYQELLDELDD